MTFDYDLPMPAIRPVEAASESAIAAMSIPHIAALCELAYHDYMVTGAFDADVGTYHEIFAYGRHKCETCGDSDDLDCFARVHFIGRDVVVAIRGTDTPVDWAANLDYRVCGSVDGLAAHNGFCHGAQVLYREIRRVLHDRPLLPTIRRIIVAGHSKGGGEAQALALLLALSLGVPVSLVTFGAPACGKAHFARALRGWLSGIRMYRFAADPVAKLPPTWRGYEFPVKPVTFRCGWFPWLTAWLAHESAIKLFHSMSSYLTRVNLECANDHV